MKQLSWDMNRGCPSAENVFAIGVKLHDNFAPPDFLLVIFPPPHRSIRHFRELQKYRQKNIYNLLSIWLRLDCRVFLFLEACNYAFREAAQIFYSFTMSGKRGATCSILRPIFKFSLDGPPILARQRAEA